MFLQSPTRPHDSVGRSSIVDLINRQFRSESGVPNEHPEQAGVDRCVDLPVVHRPDPCIIRPRFAHNIEIIEEPDLARDLLR